MVACWEPVTSSTRPLSQKRIADGYLSTDRLKSRIQCVRQCPSGWRQQNQKPGKEVLKDALENADRLQSNPIPRPAKSLCVGPGNTKVAVSKNPMTQTMIRTNLASANIQAKAGLRGQTSHFSNLQPPNKRAISPGTNSKKTRPAIDVWEQFNGSAQ